MGAARRRLAKVEGDLAVKNAVGAADEAHASFEPAEVMAELERDGVTARCSSPGSRLRIETTPIERDIAYSQLVNDWTGGTGARTWTGSRPGSSSRTGTSLRR